MSLNVAGSIYAINAPSNRLKLKPVGKIINQLSAIAVRFGIEHRITLLQNKRAKLRAAFTVDHYDRKVAVLGYRPGCLKAAGGNDSEASLGDHLLTDLQTG